MQPVTYELTTDKHGIMHWINGERVLISYTWSVSARVKSRRKVVRVKNFEISATRRSQTDYAIKLAMKGNFVLEVLSLTPTGFWSNCFWFEREGCPIIDPDILKQFSLPDNL
jgi:hypothetical protein